MPSPKSKHRSSSTSLAHLSTGAAVRRGEIKISDPIPVDSSYDGQLPSTTVDINAMSTTVWPQDTTWPRKSTPPEMNHIRNASYGHDRTDFASRVSAGPSLIPSSVSTAPSKGSLTPRKSSGGFRSALKRMFGSKRGRLTETRKDAHRSDPGNLTSIMEKQPNHRVTQIPTQAAGHVTRAEALGSHGPTNSQQGLPRNSSERKRLKSPRRRRRNTLPSLILSEQEAQILAGPKDDLASRSWRDAEPMPNKFKRRSRSADALNEMATDLNLKEIDTQDRKSQIAYWRTSVIENPTPSYRVWAADNDFQNEPQLNTSDLTPVQTFDFGLEKPGTEPASLEDRVNTLEVKIFDFEYAIAKLQGHNIPKPLLHPKPQPAKIRSIHELFPQESEKSSLSLLPVKEPTSFLNSPDESPMPNDHDECYRPDRSSKATTIRPLTARRLSPPRSDAPSPSPSHVNMTQFDQLMDIIKQEQTARRQLEQQVADLQKEVEILRAPIYAEIRPALYPTPSPESVHETPMAPRHLHRSPRFHDQKVPETYETSRFSMSDSVDTGAETDTDDGFQESFETPQGNRFTFETTRGSPLIGVS